MTTRVLACIDHSRYQSSVCQYAAWAAARLIAPLHLLHVLDQRMAVSGTKDYSGSIGLGAQDALLAELASLDEQRSKLAQEQGRRLLEAGKIQVATAGYMTSDARQCHGGLLETLSEMEPNVRLFVLGRRGEAAELAPDHIGSNLERAIRALHRPILVAPETFNAPQSAMIAFDGSTSTRKGVEMIAASPLFKGLACHVVMAGAETPANQETLGWAGTILMQGGVNVTTALIAGEAEMVLSTYLRAFDLDMLVMGAYGHSRIRHLLIGSTTTNMIRTAPVPVLLLR
ncbi:universal stress protein [Pseudogulbenkiania subflava]|uniref:Universal stress protein family protein n=1 Tax=Pseudogulbenkiania subflava DSM 22618 TaxID=1123014 RepID=A0A1Y6BVK0_9NEIS|nr:universal stress protein [Pseudogulbenkiania subflava]SMF23327.1 Universal stress protein family protein [Pseudogulbenkiania subflava DSM 22618]SMF32693.1 Universal stress protein family protein [Pseudogulbenkiania subflava DSM 22618]SMF47727.1 Universal stress protein family protein [Pseudogulbenkiania subflava DSM 22618]